MRINPSPWTVNNLVRLAPAEVALTNVGKSFRRGPEIVDVLDHINLVAAPGQGLAILGPSGCGKSTLLRLLPAPAWVPLLVLWMEIYEGPKVTLVAIGAFFPVFTTVASGFVHADRDLIKVGRAYGLAGRRLITGTLLPTSSPTIFAGLRLGLAQSWLVVVAAELIAGSKGLRFLLIDGQNTSRTDILLLAIISLASLGKSTDFVLASLEKRALSWV